MTTTKLFSGLEEAGARSSSRVLAPPGGRSSNIFGGDDTPPAQQQKRAQPQGQTNILGQSPAASPQAPPPQAQDSPSAQQPQEQATPPAPEPAPTQKHRDQYNPITGELVTKTNPTENETKLNNNKQRGGAYNPITGQGYGDSKPQENAAPSTRVRNPPGGKSSGPLW